MNPDELVRRLMRTFVAELDGHVRALSRDLVALEQASSSIVRAELVRSLLRTMHSLKGASQSVRVSELELACHRFEEILIRLQPSGPEDRPQPALVGLLLATTDAIHEAGHRLERGETLRGSRLEALMPRLEKAAGGAAPAAGAEPGPAPPVTTPADRIESVRSADALLGRANAEAERRPAPSGPTETVPPAARFADVCEGLDRSVADLAAQAGKQVRLSVRGGAQELDVELVERLRDPLRHLVRNAVDHGIEAPMERVALGKPAEGRIELSAALDGRHVLVVADDDGRGIDAAAVRDEARRRGVVDPDGPATRLVFVPGLSTRPIATGLSGRGMGLDVVRARVEALGGSIQVETEPGRGTRFQLRLPLAVPATRVLLVEAAGQAFALPADEVLRAVEVGPATLRKVLGRPVVIGHGAPLAVVTLSAALALDDAPWRPEDPAELKPAVVVQPPGGAPLALVVDRLDGVHDLVLRGLGRRATVPMLSGAVVLAPERLALVVRTEEIARAVARPGAAVAGGIVLARARRRPRLALVERSPVGAEVLRRVAGRAGFDVEVVTSATAPDLLARTSPFDAIVVIRDALTPPGSPELSSDPPSPPVLEIDRERFDEAALVEALRGIASTLAGTENEEP